jgi:hypothetical protein
MSSDLFFHPERERGPARAVREARAKNVCRRCPVMAQCRDHALIVHEPYGVWGGLTEEERKQQLRTDAAHTATVRTGADVAQPVVIGVDFTPAAHRRRSRGPGARLPAGGMTTARSPSSTHARTSAATPTDRYGGPGS